MIDVNNVVSLTTGEVVLRQVVLWRWEDHGRGYDYHCADWRLAVKCGQLERIGGSWWIVFDRQLIRARVDGIETWTGTDVEVDDRKRWPMELRRKLR